MRRGKKQIIKIPKLGLPWWLSVKNLPVSAGDMGSIPDLQRSLHSTEQLNRRTTAAELALRSLWSGTSEVIAVRSPPN